MDKFIEKLNKKLTYLLNNFGEHCEEWGSDKEGDCHRKSCSDCVLTHAIEIVNQLAEEHKGGWIPCEVDLPKISNAYLVTKMCENDGNPIYNTAHEIFWTSDKKWDCERDEDCEWKVIAWQHRLAPYQPKGE